MPSRFIAEAGKRLRAFKLGGARPVVREGQRVVHPRYGAGLVTRLEPGAGQPMVSVVFDEGGEKKLALAYARLQPA